MESEIRLSSNTMDGIKGSVWWYEKVVKHANDKSIPETNSSHLKIDASVGRLISFFGDTVTARTRLFVSGMAIAIWFHLAIFFYSPKQLHFPKPNLTHTPKRLDLYHKTYRTQCWDRPQVWRNVRIRWSVGGCWTTHLKKIWYSQTGNHVFRRVLGKSNNDFWNHPVRFGHLVRQHGVRTSMENL